ncbi:MAG: leucine-rich repeat domain-containing protein, partial [Clostridia bacterium]|nr:leucine-rich repeat domain-containing protein [Clostridia bacterium]
MKKQLKAALAATLALLLALAVMPVSALPKLEAEKNAIEPCWTVPAGYNVHDYTKCVEFLEQTDEDGVKNGDKLSDNYDPNDPGTWGVDSFRWTATNGEQRLLTISAYSQELYGSLDVSGCTALEELWCSDNNLTELNVRGCTALENLYCYYNNLSELDVTQNTALELLWCDDNNLTELDVSGCTALYNLYCGLNNLSELDVSGCTALVELYCYNNNLSELNVSG